MPRVQRLDLRNELHIVRIHGRDGAYIIFDPSVLVGLPENSLAVNAPHVRQFVQLLGETCAVCGCILHAYSVEPNSAAWIVRTAGLPLAALMLRLGGQYSRYLHSRQLVPENINPFARRYESKVLAPEYLPHAIRRVHRSPSLAGLCQRPAGYPFSSAQAYLGRPTSVPLDLTAVHEVLERRGLSGLRGYREFMDQPETLYVANLFENGSALDARIVGTPLFVRQAHDRAAHRPAPPTREQLIAAVAKLMDKAPAAVLWQAHVGALSRALVAWYGLRAGTASLAEIGAWFGVRGATLGQGIRHYRQLAPRLFQQLGISELDYQSGTRFTREYDEEP